MKRIACLIALALTWGGTFVHAAPRMEAKDARLWAAAEAARPAQLKLLEQIVNIDSGTGDVAGGRAASAVIAARLERIGMRVEFVPAEAPGLPENLVATLEGSGRGRILLIGHVDTVFAPGEAIKRPFRIEGDRAFGPGVSDEKGGIVQAVVALEVLNELGFTDFRRITFLVETSEERGSPGARRLIDRLLEDADIELNLEPGDAPDRLTVWRKGSSTFFVDVKGRAAHAGVAPQDGRNAALELIHQLSRLSQFPTSGDGLTVNLTLMSAGSRFNIIPEDASAGINVRMRDKAQLEVVRATLRAGASSTIVPDTQVSLREDVSYPPLPSNASTDALARKAQDIYGTLGLTLGLGGNGGASESALAFEAGVPALDGLGPVGGGFHSDAEYLELRSLTPRLFLLARLMMEFGHTPPSR